MLSSITRFGTVLAAFSPVALAAVYELGDTYTGSTFLDGFDFFTQPDPQNGFVRYMDRTPATNAALVRNVNGDTYLGVDFTTPLTVNGPGRGSVRIESKKTYQEGLFIVDLKHMPSSTCGTWPHFWSVGEGDWPDNGEISIIEGVNRESRNRMSLNTDTECKTDGIGQTGTQILYDCALDSPSGIAGCDAAAASSNTYGSGLNAVGGGVYAMEWTDAAIKIWFFPRGVIPSSILNNAPNTAEFGVPDANFAGDCDFRQRFVNHKFIFNTNFCGEAGDVYGQSGCPQYAGLSSRDSCKRFVAQNPSAFSQSYWLITSFKTFKTGTVASSSSSSVESSTSTSSSSLSTSEAASSTSSEILTSSTSETATSSSEAVASSTSSENDNLTSSETATSTSSEIATSTSSDVTSLTSSEIVSSTSSSESKSLTSSEISSSTSSDIASSTASDIATSTSSSKLVSTTTDASSTEASTSEASTSTSDISTPFSGTILSSSSAVAIDVSSSYDVSSSPPAETTTSDITSSYETLPTSLSTIKDSTIIYPTGDGGDSISASDVIYPIANSTSCSTSSSSSTQIPEYAIPTTSPGYASPSSGPEYVTKTYTTTFVDVCSTGYTTVSTTFTATYEKPTAVVPTPKEYPEGFTTTVKYCPTGCGVPNTYVTVTVPCTETPYNAIPSNVDTPYDTAQPTGPSYEDSGKEPGDFPSASPYRPVEDYPTNIPSDNTSPPHPYEPNGEQPPQGHDSYPEDEETTVVYATQVVTLSVVPVPASEHHASLSSAASPVDSYFAGPSAGHPAYPSTNATAGYGAGTGVGALPSKTNDSDVPLFTGAAVTLKISGLLGGAVAALFVLVM